MTRPVAIEGRDLDLLRVVRALEIVWKRRVIGFSSDS
jgi:hypothetical protein